MAEELIKLGGYVVQGHGSDETVLWEGSESGLFTITLSEPVTNFEKLFIVGCWNDSLASQFSDYVYTDSLKLASPIQKGFFGCTGWGKKYWFLQISGNTVRCAAAKETAWGSSTASDITTYSIQKVIGIGRKAGV